MSRKTGSACIHQILNDAKISLEKGDTDCAEVLFEKAIVLYPREATFYNNLGVIYYQTQQFKKALCFFKKAVSSDAFYFDALYNLAKFYHSLDDIELVIFYLRRCLQINPLHADARALFVGLGGNCIYVDKKFNIDIEGIAGGIRFRNGYGIPAPEEISDDLLSSFVDKFDICDLEGVKILHAPFEIAGMMGTTAKLLRKIGVDATSANFYDTWLKYKCDVNLYVNGLSTENAMKVIGPFCEEAMEKYDIFHFHFARSLYPDYRDLEILKKNGKKIVFQFWGFDSRSPEIYYYNQARFLGYHPPKPYYLTRELHALHRMLQRYADVMLGSFWLPRGLWVSGMADLEGWSFKSREQYRQKSCFVKDPNKTYFLHAPTVNWKKGSHILLSLLEECKADGLPIEIIYVDKEVPEKAKILYANTDFAVDMIGHGSFGLFGLEMMAWGIPVLVYHNSVHDAIRNYPPVVKITKANFKEQIKRCIQLKNDGKLNSFSSYLRNYVITETEMRIKGIPEYVRIYADLIRGKSIPQNINKSWFEQEAKLQRGEKSMFYKYMIENEVFKQIGLDIPSYDKRMYV